MERQTITPVSVTKELNEIFQYIREHEKLLPESTKTTSFFKAIDHVQENFIDAANLLKISNFAQAYGKKYFQRERVSSQAIYQALEKGTLREITVDGIKFIDGTILSNETI